MKQGVIQIIRNWVDEFINVVNSLYNTLVGNSIIPVMVSKIQQSFWGVQNVLNDVKYAFDLFENKVATVVGNAKWYLDQLGSKVTEVLKMITGSPELIIQHPFEAFESYLKATDFNKLIEGSMALSAMNQISMVSQSRSASLPHTYLSDYSTSQRFR